MYVALSLKLDLRLPHAAAPGFAGEWRALT